MFLPTQYSTLSEWFPTVSPLGSTTAATKFF